MALAKKICMKNARVKRWWNRRQVSCQFNQQFTCSFYAQRSKKGKRNWRLEWIFTLLGSARLNAAYKHVDEINIRSISRLTGLAEWHLLNLAVWPKCLDKFGNLISMKPICYLFPIIGLWTIIGFPLGLCRYFVKTFIWHWLGWIG